jgi:hypothetical protein
MKIVNGKDFWAGLMFITFGLAFMLISRNYPMGSALRMGPAYFPTVLGGLMAVLGAIVFFASFVEKTPSPWRVFPFRPWIMVAALILMVPLYFWNDWFRGWPDGVRWTIAAITLALFLGSWGPKSLFVMMLSVAAFGYLMRPMGLAVSTVVLVMGAAFAGHEFKWKEVTILAIGAAIAVVWIFVHGLGLSMPVWPAFLE